MQAKSNDFIALSEIAIGKPQLQEAVYDGTTRAYDKRFAAMFADGADHGEAMRAQAAESKRRALRNLPDLLEQAEANLTENGFAERSLAIDLDLLDKQARSRADLPVNHFDTVIANPPFFDSASGTGAPDPTKSASSHMPSGKLDHWVKLAAGSLKAGGEAIFVHAADSLPELIAAFALRFGNLTLLPIAPRPDKSATRILMRGIKGSRAPLTLLPPLVLHPEAGNSFNPLPDAILRGQARLDW